MLKMAPKAYQCPAPGCGYRTDELEADLAIRFLEMHVSQAHGTSSRPEKPKKPELDMVGDVVDTLDWETFIHKFETYKKLAGISGDGGSHLLACLSKDVYSVLFSAYGAGISDLREGDLRENLMKLVVRKKNRMLLVMELLALKQDSDERIINFVSRVKAKARQCNLKLQCTCGQECDYTNDIILYMLIAGLNDQEIQEELLTLEDITMEKAELKAIAKEAAKYSQSEMSGDKVGRLKSSYMKNKGSESLKGGQDKKCRFCGGVWHENRESECKAYNATCNRCGKRGHFRKVCKSKKQSASEVTEDNSKEETGDCLHEGLLNMTADQPEHCLSSISTGDLVYDRRSRRWVQRSLKDKKIHILPVQLEVCRASLAGFKANKIQNWNKLAEGSFDGIADTGCSIMCAGVQACHKLGVPISGLMKSNVTLKVADGRKLTILGAVPVNISIKNRPGRVSKQLLHIVSELKNLFVSKSCLMDLEVIGPDFPMPSTQQESLDIITDPEEHPRAPCGCLTRSKTPDPPDLPFEPTEENIPKLKQFIIEYYAASTMNMCAHQQLPEMTGPPIHFTLKPDAQPVAVHTPAVVPLHWMAPVREQLMRDVELGILEKVPANEATVWQHRMVVVRKSNGTPRRTVDLQALNKATMRHSHPMTSPYIKAMSVPANTYKTVTDAWEGYHSIPLDKESSLMTQFITPFGVFRYKRDPQGYTSSGDAYNNRFDEITKDVKDSVRQVDDSLLWSQSIAKNFKDTCEYLTLLGRNGILQNPGKFQFCQQSVNWSGFVIGKDTVKPMPHLTAAVRSFPTPVNKTDMRSFMALMQQVSYSTAVAPLLLPFRRLLKEGEDWVWTNEMDTLFTEAKQIMANRIEEGVKIFDPFKTTLLLTDWCKHGVGYMLAQKHCKCPSKVERIPNTHCCKDGWRVCAVGSRFTLTAEANYSPTEGELLGVVNALEKTKYFTLGCPHLFVGTDHKPLLGLLSLETPLEKIDNPRLVRLKEKTLGWNFQTIYVPGKQLGGTDALSRYGVRHDCEKEEVSLRKHLVGLLASEELDSIDHWDADNLVGSLIPHLKPVTWADVKASSKVDEEYKVLVKLIARGFPMNKDEMEDNLKPFFRCRDKLRLVEEVVLYGDRILIPRALRSKVLEVLHSSHQGTTGMLLRAESSMFWPNMSRDIHEARNKCRTCDMTAPSQPSMPPVTPENPEYPFQHICSDYFDLAGKSYCVIVDRFSGWFNISPGKGGAVELIPIFTKLFQDMGVPESLTTDGGVAYMSHSFQDLLKQYQVRHRVSSVGFPHGNTRSEVAVKTAKRLLRTNIDNRGNLDTVAVSRALLQHRNTPDRDIGRSPAELLYGRKLRDFLPNVPDKYKWPSTNLLRREWSDIATWREKALARRCSKVHERLSEHTRDLPSLSIGDTVLVQNQLGNSPRRWERRGVVVETLPHRQYKVMMDGSRRITLRNRKFLRKFQRLDAGDHDRERQGGVGHGAKDVNQPLTEGQVRLPPVLQEDIPARQVIYPPPTPTSDQLPVEDYGLPSIPEIIPSETFSQDSGMEPSKVIDDPAPSTPMDDIATPTIRRSLRANKGVSSKYGEFYTGSHFEDATNQQMDTVQCWSGSPFYDNRTDQIVGYQNSGLPVMNTSVQVQPVSVPVYQSEDTAGCGYLYAIPLPPGHQDSRAFWTEQGWIWQ